MNDNKLKTLDLSEYNNKVNAYRLSFLEDSITGRLVEQNGDYIKIATRSGNLIVAHIDTLLSIWHVRQPRAVV